MPGRHPVMIPARVPIENAKNNSIVLMWGN